MSRGTIGFIGFGEAGSHIAKGLRESDVSVCAYDINSRHPQLGALIRQRAAESATTLVESSQEIVSACDVIFSTVTADAAEEAAGQTAVFIKPHHVYADLNSVSPETKKQIARIITNSGAHFVEAAVMAPVPPYGHRVPILLGGAHAHAFADAMQPLGMNLEVVSESIGTASAVKMFRSIIVKGIEALLTECVLGASRYDAETRVFESLKESFPGIDWPKLADYMVGRVVVHGERRAREMEQVAATLRELRIEPIMAEATARRQQWSADLNLKSQFGDKGPESYRAVLEALTARSKI